MKDFLRQQVDQKKDAFQKVNLIREYLQSRMLQSLQEQGAFLNWAFLGGTALRFLYGLPRYSEDLDFSLMDPLKSCDFEKILRKMKTVFEHDNYTVIVKAAREKNVRSAFVKFPSLLFELGASSDESEALSIKVEVDTRPPSGAKTMTTLCRRFVTINVNHYDKASLLAGKLHAILSRPYTKGRDLYDLVWYLSDPTWPAPNLELLNAALVQTGWTGGTLNVGNWREVLAHRLGELQWDRARADLMPFLERQEDLAWVAKEPCLRLIRESAGAVNRGWVIL